MRFIRLGALLGLRLSFEPSEDSRRAAGPPKVGCTEVLGITATKEHDMGTNYYLHQKPDCEYCGRAFEPLHIGKSSGGWCFSLHVIPEDNIHTLDDWRALWAKPGTFVRNEYGERVPIEDLEKIITDRNWRGEMPRRNPVDGRHCIGHGAGAWDYIAGRFS